MWTDPNNSIEVNEKYKVYFYVYLPLKWSTSVSWHQLPYIWSSVLMCMLNSSTESTEQKHRERWGTEAVFYYSWKYDYWHIFKTLCSMEILQDKYKSFYVEYKTIQVLTLAQLFSLTICYFFISHFHFSQSYWPILFIVFWICLPFIPLGLLAVSSA